MNRAFISAILIAFTSLTLQADRNHTESNITIKKAEKVAKQLEAQIKKEEKIAKEQRFYQAEEYDLSSYEVDKSSLDSIPLIEPDYDFDMDDVYD